MRKFLKINSIAGGVRVLGKVLQGQGRSEEEESGGEEEKNDKSAEGVEVENATRAKCTIEFRNATYEYPFRNPENL